MTIHHTKSEGPLVASITGNPPRLVTRALSAIAADDRGPMATRPWVHMADPHEALEAALWCYEQGMVPLLTERDPALASAVAARYAPDLLMTDAASLRALAPHLSQHTSVRAVTIVGSATSELMALAAGREVHFVKTL